MSSTWEDPHDAEWPDEAPSPSDVLTDEDGDPKTGEDDHAKERTNSDPRT